MNKIKRFIFKEEVGQLEYELSRETSVEIIEAIILKSKGMFSGIDMDLKMLDNRFSYRLTSGNTPYSIVYTAKMDFKLIEKENKTLIYYKITNSDITNVYFILLPITIFGIVLYAIFNSNEIIASLAILTVFVLGYLFSIGMNRMDRGVVFDRYKRFIDKEFRKKSVPSKDLPKAGQIR
ncbi:MAG: hypothetical protein RL660_1756 [Bacteroidota bacterium]